MGKFIAGLLAVCLAITLILVAAIFVLAGLATGAEKLCFWAHLNPVLGWFMLGGLVGVGVSLLAVAKIIPAETPTISRAGFISLARTHRILALVVLGVTFLAVGFLAYAGPVAAHRRTGERAAITFSENFGGSLRGDATGIRIVATPNGRGAQFTRNDHSRIAYGLGQGIPTQGTLEMRVQVRGGYGYAKGVLTESASSALLFTTAGPDTWYPGAAWLTVESNGRISFGMADAIGGTRPQRVLVAKQSPFRFNAWHTLGISYGSGGRAIQVDGVTVAQDGLDLPLGVGGTLQRPCDRPTLGEMTSAVWPRGDYASGFEGVVEAFRVSTGTKDWLLGRKAPASPTPATTRNLKNLRGASEWLGVWEGVGHASTITIQETVLTVQLAKVSSTPTTYTWNPNFAKAQGDDAEGRFGFEIAPASRDEWRKSYQASVDAVRKGDPIMEVSNPAATFKALETMPPGTYQVLGYYSGGDTGGYTMIQNGTYLLLRNASNYGDYIWLYRKQRAAAP